MSARVRLLVVDDSEVFTTAVLSAAERHPRVEVVGVARNGLEALDLAKRLRPDIVSMDVYMPVLGGVEAVTRLMEEVPTPIAMVTGADSKEFAGISFRAIGAGALDVLGKPASTRDLADLLDRLAVLAGVKVSRWTPRAPATTPRGSPPAIAPAAPGAGATARPTEPEEIPVPTAPLRCVGIAVSTGGPPLLETMLAELPSDYPTPLLVVQHVAPGFDEHLASWLGMSTGLVVEVAAQGVRLEAGHVYLAPYDRHLEVRMGGTLHLDGGAPRIAGHRPSGTVLLRSLARVYGARAAGLVLTGMGSDGAEGLLDLRRAGGLTAAQDAASCSVDGMPRVARELGAAQYVVRGAELARFLRRIGGAA